MAAWERDDLMSHPLDLRLVQDTYVTMFWKAAVLRDVTTWLAEASYTVVTVDASEWRDPDGMHRGLAAALSFPSYYGRNLNALDDCLVDVAAGDYGLRLDATGLVLVLLRFDVFATNERDHAQALLDIFARQARSAMLVGHRMMCLVQSDDPELSFDRVGSTAVGWNEAEWLDANRGL